MLEVVRARVLSLSIDYNHLTWETASSTEDVLDYTFQVLKSEATSGPFEPASKEVVDHYSFTDNLIKVGNIFRTYNYVVRVKHVPSGETQDFGPYRKEAEPTLVATTLRQHLNILMKEFIGRRCWVLPVRTFGMRCAVCWNPRLQKRRISGCRSCYDTGFVRGYHRPIEIWASLDPTTQAQQPAPTGRQQQQSTTGRMSFFPPVKPDDLLIEAENIRWTIRTVTKTEEQRALVTQELGLRRIETTNVEYDIPLDLGAKMEDMSFTPARNYTNPQNLDSADVKDLDYDAIFSLYRGTSRG